MAASEEYYTEIYGLRVGPVENVRLDRVEWHPNNPARKEPDQEEERVFIADLKKIGIKEPLLLTSDYKVLRGRRRVTFGRKAGLTHAPARRIIGQITDPSTLRKLIYKENNEHKAFTQEEILTSIRREYGDTRILQKAPKGIHSNTSSFVPLERIVEEEMSVPIGSAKRYLAILRDRISDEKARGRGLQITESEEAYAERQTKEWIKIQRDSERARKSIKRIEEKIIAPNTKKAQAIKADLRKLGGLDRSLKRLSRKDPSIKELPAVARILGG